MARVSMAREVSITGVAEVAVVVAVVLEAEALAAEVVLVAAAGALVAVELPASGDGVKGGLKN